MFNKKPFLEKSNEKSYENFLKIFPERKWANIIPFGLLGGIILIFTRILSKVTNNNINKNQKNFEKEKLQ